LHVDVFPEPSVTVQTTLVTPNGNAKGALLVIEATLQLSDVTGSPKTTPIAVQALFVVIATFVGHVIFGEIVSKTVIIAGAVF